MGDLEKILSLVSSILAILAFFGFTQIQFKKEKEKKFTLPFALKPPKKSYTPHLLVAILVHALVLGLLFSILKQQKQHAFQRQHFVFFIALCLSFSLVLGFILSQWKTTIFFSFLSSFLCLFLLGLISYGNRPGPRNPQMLFTAASACGGAGILIGTVSYISKKTIRRILS